MAREISVIGQGYVGLPLAQAFSEVGFRVIGVDYSEGRIAALRKGESGIEDVSDSELKAMLSNGYLPTSEYSKIENSEAVIICVPTPLSPNGNPDLAFVVDAAKSVAKHLKRSAVVILESTTYPGTTEEVLKPIFEEQGLVHGEDFFLAYSPERIDPGNSTFGILNTPKVVGGVNAQAGVIAESLYKKVCSTVVVVSGTREAEMSKLLENTYRHVNIALVNELAVVCADLGINIREVIRAAKTKPFGFAAFEPGPGVGGHCIPIDPNYLDYKVQQVLGRRFEFVSLATKINSAMPSYVAERVMEIIDSKPVESKKRSVLLVGVSYKRNISDVRETPATKLLQSLAEYGVNVEYFDPLVTEWKVDSLTVPRQIDLQSSALFDCSILLQNHDLVDLGALVENSNEVFDTRGVLSRDHPKVHHM
jgi:nucleotide sugar dehydrogenase